MKIKATIMNRTYDTILSTIERKCRKPVNNQIFKSLKTNEEIAEYFRLKYLPEGDNDILTRLMPDNENISFYDKRNNTLITFYTNPKKKIKNVTFTNDTPEELHDKKRNRTLDLKDIIRAYYEAPYSLKQSTRKISIMQGRDLGPGGDCIDFDVTIYAEGIDSLEPDLYHEMTHAFAHTLINYEKGEYNQMGTLPLSVRDQWDKARQDDYKYQKSINIMKEYGMEKQDTTEYGSEKPSEDFAEMGSVICTKLTGKDYEIPLSYYIMERECPESHLWKNGDKRHEQTSEEIIRLNPNRARLMESLIRTGKHVGKENMAYSHAKREEWVKRELRMRGMA